MDRRTVIKYTALMTGAAVGAPLISSLVWGCRSDHVSNSLDHQLQFFSKKDFELLKDVIDTILPRTDSPSATEAGVHRTIDTMVGAVYNKEDKEAYKKGFVTLVKYLNAQGGPEGYLPLEAEAKLAILKELDLSENEANEETRDAYKDLKQQTISYYLSSEEIAEQYLNYLPIPGEYEACIPLSDVGGKLWAI